MCRRPRRLLDTRFWRGRLNTWRNHQRSRVQEFGDSVDCHGLIASLAAQTACWGVCNVTIVGSVDGSASAHGPMVLVYASMHRSVIGGCANVVMTTLVRAAHCRSHQRERVLGASESLAKDRAAPETQSCCSFPQRSRSTFADTVAAVSPADYQ